MIGSIFFLLLVGAGVIGLVIGVQKNKKKVSESTHEPVEEVVEEPKVVEKPKIVKEPIAAVQKKEKPAKVVKTTAKKKVTKNKQ